jgi:hypothetical protein
MTVPDPDGPMQGPRNTRDVMKRAPAPPVAEDDAPEAPATDAATTAVEVGQEAA